MKSKENKILITGAAGFIGYHITKIFIDNGLKVVGIDNLNSYYSVQLKKDRTKQLFKNNKSLNYSFKEIDIRDKKNLFELFENEKFSHIIHLAAQAGVRHSISNPEAYISSNIEGFLNILEASRLNHVNHLYYASSSSVYGNQKKVPYNEKDKTDNPVSLYAATKKANELIAHSYSCLYNIRTTGLRFFTVYGPWGRPDMAPMLFMNALLNNKAIKVFNNGDLKRDFTYVDDIATSLFKLFIKDNLNSPKNFRIFNIGNSKPILLKEFIKTIELIKNKKFKMKMLPMQQGDVYQTYADTQELENYIGNIIHTPLDFGLEKFITWYDKYFK